MRQIGLGTFITTPKMRELVNQVLDSGRLSYGPMSQQFESRFAAMHGCKYGVLSNSGTSSLLVALQTLKEIHGWQDGDEVIIPAITFVATANVVLQLRLKPILVDVEQDYYGIDPGHIYNYMSSALGHKKVKAVIPVHTFGQPCDLYGVHDILKRWLVQPQVKVIEDSCEAMLVSHLDEVIGKWSDITCFSTYIAHLLVTGVGGLSITNNPEYALNMRSLVNHGIDLSELPNGEDYDPTWLARKFTFCRVGHSFRLTEMEAALGLAQLDDLPAIIKQRQDNAAYLMQGLKPFEDRLQLPAIRPNTDHSFMMLPLVCRQAGVRNRLMTYLNQNGIGTRLMLPLTDQPVYKGLWNPDDYPVAKWINESGFYIGTQQDLTQDDMDYVLEKFGEFFDG